jgi:hypothetical protein
MATTRPVTNDCYDETEDTQSWLLCTTQELLWMNKRCIARSYWRWMKRDMIWCYNCFCYSKIYNQRHDLLEWTLQFSYLFEHVLLFHLALPFCLPPIAFLLSPFPNMPTKCGMCTISTTFFSQLSNIFLLPPPSKHETISSHEKNTKNYYFSDTNTKHIYSNNLTHHRWIKPLSGHARCHV